MICPFLQTATPQPLGLPALAVLCDKPSRFDQVVFRTGTDEGQPCRSDRESKKTASERRDVVVIALGGGAGDDIDLSIGQSEFPIKTAGLRAARLRVRQVELGRARFQNDGGIWRGGD